MARYSFRLPDIGEGIAEAEIVAWHVRVGDRIEEDAQLADMMTDKATVEMESPVSGLVVELSGEVGDSVAIGSTLVVIEIDDAVEDETVPAGETLGADVDPAAEAGSGEHLPHLSGDAIPKASELLVGEADPMKVESLRKVTKEGSGFEAADEGADRPVLASPAVRRRAETLGVDLRQIRSEGDRVRHADLDAFIRYNGAQGYRAPGAERVRSDEAIKVIGMRRKIAENMSASKRSIPHFTYVDELDVTALETMRADLNADRGDRPKLTLLPFLIVAVCRAIPQFPMINARYDDEAGIVTRYGAVHLGMATQTDAGLMVPVIRDAQRKNVWQLADEIGRLAAAARAGKAKATELTGSTLTITSLGSLGGVATTPVINRPEVAIIGPNRIIERPVFAKDALGREKIGRAKLMNMSISCDHRVVDGWDAASFIQALKASIERPVLLFAD